MNRRKFSQSLASALGITMLPASVVVAGKVDSGSLRKSLSSSANIHTNDGLNLKLIKHEFGTQNLDEKQFILTYQVDNAPATLEEKIYHLKVGDGEEQPVYMTPVADNQLQAVFNWRLNA